MTLGLGRLLLLVSVLGLSAPYAAAWGDKGHQMTARVAVRALPSDMPEFFRKAEVELGYLCPEPDRWRREDREPALRGLHHYDHTVKFEYITEPLPKNRFEFLMAYLGKDKPAGGRFNYTDIGFAPYAMAEQAEMLAVNFMLWRQAPEHTEIERRIKRQIEQNIIHIAGLLSHFVTDTGQPLHTTVHGNGWNNNFPNPKGYAGPDIHRRFETDFVDQAIEEKDFAPLVEKKPKVLGPWLEEAMHHIRRSFAHVESVYAFDQEKPFGKGGESAEAKRFTCERLAYSATALRDFWYSAWVKSERLSQPSLR